jgi:hypothetical protein
LYQHPDVSRQVASLAPYAGIAGSLWLAATITTLSVAEYDFMRGLGWHPLASPTIDWPSGLALGPHGNWMVAAFVGCGALLPVFARGLEHAVGQTLVGRTGARLVAGAGVAMLLLGFKTDPTLAGGPRTWHGLLHDAAYALLGLLLLPAFVALGLRFRQLSRWRVVGAYTIATIALAAPAFVLKGALFYAFLIAMLAWFTVVSLMLWRAAKR